MLIAIKIIYFNCNNGHTLSVLMKNYVYNKQMSLFQIHDLDEFFLNFVNILEDYKFFFINKYYYHFLKNYNIYKTWKFIIDIWNRKNNYYEYIYILSEYHDYQFKAFDYVQILFDLSCGLGNELSFYLMKRYEININHKNNSPFRICCYCENLKMAKWLLKYSSTKIDINAVNKKLHNAFCICCMRGNLQIGKWLCEQGKINIHFNNDKAFVLCCKYGKLEMAKWLMKMTIDPNIGQINNKALNDAFCYCCVKNNVEIAKWLIESNMVELDIHIDEEKPFRLCCKYGNLEMAMWLYYLSNEMNNEINMTKWISYDLVYSLKKPFLNVLSFKRVIDDALCCCCVNGNLEMAKWIYSISKEIDHDLILNMHVNGEEPVRLCFQYNNFEMAKWLIELSMLPEYESIKLDVFVVTEKNLEYGHDYDITKRVIDDIFCWCCINGNVDMIKWLIKLIKTCNFKIVLDINHNNDEPFCLACEYGKLNVAKWLLKFSDKHDCIKKTRINIHASSEYAFRMSCHYGYHQVVKWLIKTGENENYGKINIHTHDEYAFRMSCVNGHMKTCEYLLGLDEKGYGKINIHSQKEYAFYYSFMKNKFNIVDWLIQLSLDPKYGKIDVHLDNDSLILIACINNDLKKIKMLIDFSQKYDLGNYRIGCTNFGDDINDFLKKYNNHNTILFI